MARLFVPVDQRTREIDTHYQLQCVAENTSQLVEYYETTLDIQRTAARHALENHRQSADILASVDDSLQDIATVLGSLESIATEGVVVLRAGFSRLADLMLHQQAALQQIAETLRRPYETRVQELLHEADRALTAGMGRGGREQQSDFGDAKDLLTRVLENPIGRRNDVAWFQMGWLLWKSGNIPGAAEAFFHSARLSAERRDHHHAAALRHLAHAEAMQGLNEDADATIRRALGVAPNDVDIQYDAARSAARLGDRERALGLLGRLLPIRPSLHVSVFAEPDFAGMVPALAHLIATETKKARTTAQDAVSTWCPASAGR